MYCASKATSIGKFWQNVKDALASIDKPVDHTILMDDFKVVHHTYIAIYIAIRNEYFVVFSFIFDTTRSSLFE